MAVKSTETKEQINTENQPNTEIQSPSQTTTQSSQQHTYTPPLMDSYSSLQNLADNDIYFSLVQGGDLSIKANGYLDLLNRDIVSLRNNSNIFFVGTGNGANARIYIQNPDLRIYVGFDSADGKVKQQVLTDELCQEILDSKSQKQFEKLVNEKVVSYHERVRIMNYAKKVKLDSFEKITFLEEHSGKKFKEI